MRAALTKLLSQTIIKKRALERKKAARARYRFNFHTRLEQKSKDPHNGTLLKGEVYKLSSFEHLDMAGNQI